MSYERLTKEEALELITSIIDNEVDEDTRLAFFSYLENDSYVKRQYESALRIKNLIATRCPAEKAPDRLRYRVRVLLAAERASLANLSLEEPVYDIPCKKTPFSYPPKGSSDNPLSVRKSRKIYQQAWFYVSATVIAVTFLLWSIVYVSQSASSSYSIEEYTYRHFINHKGSFIQPTISAANMRSAETMLAADFNLPIAIPLLANAEFKGVVFTDFVPGYPAPLMEYYVPGEDQYIYIFAFDIDKLDEYKMLSRNEEAVKACINPGDFHIDEVQGKHVVSWKWDNIWYAAISNHDGKTLASLIQPLQLNASRE